MVEQNREIKVKNGNWSIDGDEFVVLVNHEGQHSLWPSALAVPDGWTQTGPAAAFFIFNCQECGRPVRAPCLQRTA